MRPIDSTLHGATDYTVGALLTTVFPRLAGIEGTPAGRQVRAAGAFHAGYSTLTNYPLGIVKAIPYKAHLALDAVGMEASWGHGALHAVERMKQATRSETDRGAALRQAILACRPAGIVSIIGVYGGLMDKFPTGAFMNKGLQLRTGQCHVHKYLQPLYEHIKNGDIDPSFVITHELPLDAAPDAYETFKHKKDDCVKVVLKP